MRLLVETELRPAAGIIGAGPTTLNQDIEPGLVHGVNLVVQCRKDIPKLDRALLRTRL
jgi:hypothetical protein